LSEGRQVDYYVDGFKTPCTQDATHRLQGGAFLLSLWKWSVENECQMAANQII